MKRAKLPVLALLIALLFTAVPMARSTAAFYGESTPSGLDGEISKTVEYIKSSLGTADDSTLAKVLADGAGAGCDWYALALKRLSYPVDMAAYADALEAKLCGGEITGAVERQRCALILMALGRGEIADEILGETAGKLGLMSLVFALHLADGGAKCDTVDAGYLVERILELELEGGGWAIMGKYADIDTTAMTLQALSRHEDDTRVADVISRALAIMEKKQCEDGGFSSYGVENAESCAQVIIALCSLGAEIDTLPITPIYERILSYRCEGGGFSHTEGGEPSTSATAQSLCALVSLKLFYSNVGGFYEIHKKLPATPSVELPTTTTSKSDTTARPTTTAPVTSTSDADGESDGVSPKVIILAAVIASAAVISVVLLFRGKHRRRDVLLVWLAAAIVCAATMLVKFETVDEHFAPQTTENAEKQIGEVTFSIRCDKLLSFDDELIPEDGAIIDRLTISLYEGESVLDLLDRAARESGVLIVERGGYVSSIAGLAEQAFGDLSGWVYFVNGSMPSVGGGEYRPHDGDVIEWHYTLDLGNDIGE